MFYVYNADNEILAKFRTLSEAKECALALKAELGENFNIEKREWVWSTTTLDELVRDARAC